MSRILNIVVNYKNEDEVIDYSKQLFNQNNSENLVLIVVNNVLKDRTIKQFENQLKAVNMDQIYLYNANDNLGYLGAAIYGYNTFISEKHNFKWDWIIISNTDIQYKQVEFFETFFDEKYSKDVWWIGPSVYNSATKAYDNPKYIDRISNKKMKRLLIINKSGLFAAVYILLGKIKKSSLRRTKTESEFVYALQGCYFVLRKEFMDLIKDVNYEGFLFSEESYLGEMLLENNKKAYYNSNVEIVHNENTSTGGLSNRARAKYYYKSLKKVYSRFYKK